MLGQTDRHQSEHWASQETQEKQEDLSHQLSSALWRRVPAQPLAQRATNQLWNLLPADRDISPHLSAAEPRAGTAHCLLSTGHSNVRNVTHPGVRRAGALPEHSSLQGRTGKVAGMDTGTHSPISPEEQSRCRHELPVPICAHRSGQSRASRSHCAVTQLAGLMCARGFSAETLGKNWTSP